MSADLRILTAVLAVGAALGIGACNEDKTADKTPGATTASEKAAAAVDAAKEKAKDVAEKVAGKVEAAKEAVKDAAAKVDSVQITAEANVGKAVDAAKAAVAAAAPAKPAEAPVASDAAAKPAETKAAEAPAAPAAPAPAAEAKPADAAGAANPVADVAKTMDGITFKDSRYRDKNDTPTPVVTKDYQVDWATWQGFRRYHDACHVCHGPNALGSTFAPSLAESLKTIDYPTFYGIVVGGQQREAGGTKYIMPAFGEDKNVMCYLDDIYTYIKARSLNAEGKGGMPPGRPNGREDISAEAKKRAADCEG